MSDVERAAELLPCPFCGHPAWRPDNLAAGDFCVDCTVCGGSTTLYDNQTAADAQWNRREHAQALAQQAEAVAAARMEAHRLASEIAELADEVAFSWKYQAIFGRTIYLDPGALTLLLPEDLPAWREAEQQLAQARTDENRDRLASTLQTTGEGDSHV